MQNKTDIEKPCLILILCPTYQKAEDAYYQFIAHIVCSDSVDEIVNRYDAGLCITLDNDLTYIFIDEHWKHVVENELDAYIDYDYMYSFEDDLYNEDVPFYDSVLA